MRATFLKVNVRTGNGTQIRNGMSVIQLQVRGLLRNSRFIGQKPLVFRFVGLVHVKRILNQTAS